MKYTEFRFYSPLHGFDVVRLSVRDTQGGEHFAIVADGNGYGARRKEALASIEKGISERKAPGEVYPWGMTADPFAKHGQQVNPNWNQGVAA